MVLFLLEDMDFKGFCMKIWNSGVSVITRSTFSSYPMACFDILSSDISTLASVNESTFVCSAILMMRHDWLPENQRRMKDPCGALYERKREREMLP